MNTSEIKGVVFDFGGVMTTTTMPERVRAVVDGWGIPWSALETGYAKYRRLMDGAEITMDEMYARIWSDAGITVAPDVQARIVAEDVASFLYRNERTLGYMRRLKAAGYRLGILTNMPPDFAPHFREHFPDFLALADALVISGLERLYKPQRAIYDLLRERIGLKPEELLFIDDVETNCRGAEAAGWHALRFVSNEQVERAFPPGQTATA